MPSSFAWRMMGDWWFQDGTLNPWKAKAWKERSKWGFLNELPIDGKPERPLLAPRLLRDGEVVEPADRLGLVAGRQAPTSRVAGHISRTYRDTKR